MNTDLKPPKWFPQFVLIRVYSRTSAANIG